MHRLVRVAAPMFAVLALLHGCSKTPECPEVTTVMPDITSEVSTTGEESYDCAHAERADYLQQTWCEAREQLDLSSHADSPDTLKGYVKGYRKGLNHARQAQDSRMARISVEGKSDSPEDAGYKDGYNKVLRDLGIMEFDCTSNDNASEYKDRWCEAADSYRTAGLGGDNPFTKGRFIDGYMAGGRVALTVPTSMEAFFSGDNPEGKQPAIVQPEGDIKGTELAFYRGFDEGYKAMIASIRESINQVMQQMQIPNNMELPEGMMPPQLGQ